MPQPWFGSCIIRGLSQRHFRSRCDAPVTSPTAAECFQLGVPDAPHEAPRKPRRCVSRSCSAGMVFSFSLTPLSAGLISGVRVSWPRPAVFFFFVFLFVFWFGFATAARTNGTNRTIRSCSRRKTGTAGCVCLDHVPRSAGCVCPGHVRLCFFFVFLFVFWFGFATAARTNGTNRTIRSCSRRKTGTAGCVCLDHVPRSAGCVCPGHVRLCFFCFFLCFFLFFGLVLRRLQEGMVRFVPFVLAAVAKPVQPGACALTTSRAQRGACVLATSGCVFCVFFFFCLFVGLLFCDGCKNEWHDSYHSFLQPSQNRYSRVRVP